MSLNSDPSPGSTDFWHQATRPCANTHCCNVPTVPRDRILASTLLLLMSKNNPFPRAAMKNRMVLPLAAAVLYWWWAVFWFPNLDLSSIPVKNQAALYVFCLPRKEISDPLYKEKYFPCKQGNNHWSRKELPFNNEYNSRCFWEKRHLQRV